MNYKIIRHEDTTIHKKKCFTALVTIPGKNNPAIVMQEHKKGHFKPFYEKTLADKAAVKFIAEYKEPEIVVKEKIPVQMELF